MASRPPKVVFPPPKKAFPAKVASRDAEAERLIRKARKHPLGISFLREGMLDSVSAIFQVHSFTVERAREALAKVEKPRGRAVASRGAR